MLPWNHNAYYHRVILRRVPRGAGRVLEVGCGVGHLAADLARKVQHVDVVDVDASMVDATRAIVPANVNCLLADIMEMDLSPDYYDAIVSLSALHHLDLQPALTRLADALRPGGVLIAVALPQLDVPRDLPVELAASTYHHLLGVALTVTRHPWKVGLPHPADPGPVPMKDPVLTTRQVRQCARTVLPGVTVRRLLLWRYLLTWRKPALVPANN